MTSWYTFFFTCCCCTIHVRPWHNDVGGQEQPRSVEGSKNSNLHLAPCFHPIDIFTAYSRQNVVGATSAPIQRETRLVAIEHPRGIIEDCCGSHLLQKLVTSAEPWFDFLCCNFLSLFGDCSWLPWLQRWMIHHKSLHPVSPRPVVLEWILSPTAHKDLFHCITQLIFCEGNPHCSSWFEVEHHLLLFFLGKHSSMAIGWLSTASSIQPV